MNEQQQDQTPQVSVDPNAVVGAYTEELAQMTRRALVAETAATTLQQENTALRKEYTTLQQENASLRERFEATHPQPSDQQPPE